MKYVVFRLSSSVGCIYAPHVEFVTDDVCCELRIRCMNAPYKNMMRFADSLERYLRLEVLLKNQAPQVRTRHA
jgi:hypothetical protein